MVGTRTDAKSKKLLFNLLFRYLKHRRFQTKRPVAGESERLRCLWLRGREEKRRPEGAAGGGEAGSRRPVAGASARSPPASCLRRSGWQRRDSGAQECGSRSGSCPPRERRAPGTVPGSWRSGSLLFSHPGGPLVRGAGLRCRAEPGASSARRRAANRPWEPPPRRGARPGPARRPPGPAAGCAPPPGHLAAALAGRELAQRDKMRTN